MHTSRSCDMEATTSSSRKRRIVVDVEDDDDVNGGYEYDQQQKAQQLANTRIASDNLIQLDSLKFLRVLLVEFDDSTRSIIAALLRKSGYRVVSVPDGLKAWETLKGKPQTIDLVLAEVELPSICGFSLLSMIMGDDTCSNIPVIMMSSYDEVNVVFKCMLKGAADFLVKPVRKNELRNLWQHVWRRHSVRDSHQNGISSQLKTEPTDETSSTKLSNHCVASLKETKELNEKRSDAQSSCTKPDMEDDTTDIENRQNLSFRNSAETSRATESVKVDEMLLRQANEVADKSSRVISDKAPCNQSNYSAMPIQAREDTNTGAMSLGKDPAPETQGMDINYENDKQLKPSRVAIDLIGSFDNHLDIYQTPREVPNNTAGLELSLRRSHFSDNEIQEDAELQKLKHSDASAFSRYNQTTLHTPLDTESKESANFSCKNQQDQALNHTAEVPKKGVISVPRPTRGTKVDGLYSGLGSSWPQLFYTPVGPLPLLNSNSTPFQEAAYHVYSPDQSNKANNDHHHHQSNSKPINTMMHEQQPKVESFDGSRYISAATTQSVTSSLCNSSSNINSSGCGSVCDGSNGIETAVNTAGVVTEHGNEIGAFMPDGCKGLDSHCLSQREAALNKFRLKRKDRCFDKKVRYQSRKKLAEQRPRVKGQFVRQIPS